MNMLNRALEASADDVQKADVKDAFASMLQNLFSFLSLKVNYLTDRKMTRQESSPGRQGRTLPIA